MRVLVAYRPPEFAVKIDAAERRSERRLSAAKADDDAV
jgi:hypothetical protein